MNKHRSEEDSDRAEQLLAPRLVAPRTPPDDELFPPLVDIEPHLGQMYVVGHEPHVRPVTLLRPVRR